MKIFFFVCVQIKRDGTTDKMRNFA